MGWAGWNAPGASQTSLSNTWYRFGIAINSTGNSATLYYDATTSTNPAPGTILNSTTYSITNNGSYIGLGGDAVGGTLNTYWDNIITRKYVSPEPANGTWGSEEISYVWNQSGSASWSTSTNWTPTRTTPATNDILQFNGGGSITVTNVPTQTIGQLVLSGNTTVNLQPSSSSKTLTVNNALFTTSGDVLNLGSGIILAGTLTTLSNRGKIQTAVIATTSFTPIPASMIWGGIVEFNGSGAQTSVGGIYSTLKINNSTGVTLASATTDTTLTIGDVTTSSIFSDGGYAVSTATTLNLKSGTYNCSIPGASAFIWGTLTASSGTTVNYNASTAQTIANKSYSNLTLSGSGNKTFSTTATISGTLSISGTALAALATGTNTSVNQLMLGGVTEISGTWGSTNSSATNKNSTYFATSTGYVTVSSGWIAGIWTGNTSTDWNTASNWVGSSIPVSGTNVVIPTISINQPSLGLSGAGTCNNLTINSGDSLVIQSGTSLTVSGAITNNNSNAGLILKSNTNGTATLIHTTTGVKGKAQRYIPIYTVERYHYFSSPVDSANILTIFDPAYGNAPVYYYNYNTGGLAYTGSTMIHATRCGICCQVF